MAVAVKKHTDPPEDAGAQSAAAAKVNILVVDDLPEKLVAYRAMLDELGPLSRPPQPSFFSGEEGRLAKLSDPAGKSA